MGGAALWCLLFLNEAQSLRAVATAAEDPENAVNEERNFADNGGDVNHFTRASYIEFRKRGPTSAVRARGKVADTFPKGVKKTDLDWFRSCDSFEGVRIS